MRHRSELGVNSEQHQTDIEVILQRRRNEIEFNVVEVFAFSFSFGGGGGGGGVCHLNFTFKKPITICVGWIGMGWSGVEWDDSTE
jgi:hypothetical protein